MFTDKMLSLSDYIWTFPFMQQNKKSKLQILVCEQGIVLRLKCANQNLPIRLTCTIRRDVALQIWPFVKKQPKIVHSAAVKKNTKINLRWCTTQFDFVIGSRYPKFTHPQANNQFHRKYDSTMEETIGCP